MRTLTNTYICIHTQTQTHTHTHTHKYRHKYKHQNTHTYTQTHTLTHTHTHTHTHMTHARSRIHTRSLTYIVKYLHIHTHIHLNTSAKTQVNIWWIIHVSHWCVCVDVWLFVAGLQWFVYMNCQMEWKVYLFQGNNLKRKLSRWLDHMSGHMWPSIGKPD